MKVKINQKITFNVISPEVKIKPKQIPILFLHGFTGNAKDWKFAFEQVPELFYPLAVDLLGHGETTTLLDRNEYRTDSLVESLNLLVKKIKIEKFVLCGYSMGGRLALSYSTKYKNKILGLILESTSPGLKDPLEKAARLNSDDNLAKFIKDEGVDKFIDHWFSLPLFDTLNKLPVEELERIKSERRINNPVGLINTLEGFGTGMMPNLWKSFSKITYPCLLISGELDEKFSEINKKCVNNYNSLMHVTISGAGHNSHVEQKSEFISVLNNFLNKNFKGLK